MVLDQVKSFLPRLLPLERRKYPNFFLSFFFLNFILFLNFTVLYWFCHISKWIRHRPNSYIQWILEGEVQHIAFLFNGRILRLGNLLISHRAYLNCLLSYCHCCIFGIWENGVSSGKCIHHPEKEVAWASVRQWMRECEVSCSPLVWCSVLLSHLPQSPWSFLRSWSSLHPSFQAGAMSPWSASPQETEKTWR